MKRYLFFKRPGTIAAILCAGSLQLCASAQSAPTAATANPRMPMVQSDHSVNPMSDFDGLNYSDEQKTQIDKLRAEMRGKLDTVSRDSKLDEYQKSAMLEGFQRIEYRELYNLLTPDQKVEVKKRVVARRALEKKDAPHQPQIPLR